MKKDHVYTYFSEDTLRHEASIHATNLTGGPDDPLLVVINIYPGGQIEADKPVEMKRRVQNHEFTDNKHIVEWLVRNINLLLMDLL